MTVEPQSLFAYVSVIHGILPYNSLFVTLVSTYIVYCSTQHACIDSYQLVVSNVEVIVQVIEPYTRTVSTVALKKFLLSLLERMDSR